MFTPPTVILLMQYIDLKSQRQMVTPELLILSSCIKLALGWHGIPYLLITQRKSGLALVSIS